MYRISINLIYCLIENANQEGKTLSSVHLVFHAGQGFLLRVRQKQISINSVSNLNLSVKVNAECLYGLPDALLGILNFLFFLYQFSLICWDSSPLKFFAKTPFLFLFEFILRSALQQHQRALTEGENSPNIFNPRPRFSFALTLALNSQWNIHFLARDA